MIKDLTFNDPLKITTGRNNDYTTT